MGICIRARAAPNGGAASFAYRLTDSVIAVGWTIDRTIDLNGDIVGE